jgi:hypothetical protein
MIAIRKPAITGYQSSLDTAPAGSVLSVLRSTGD